MMTSPRAQADSPAPLVARMERVRSQRVLCRASKGSPDRYDPMLGEPFRAGLAHIMTLGSIRVTGSRNELAASPLDTNHASEKRRFG